MAKVRPSTFLRAVLVKPISLSQKKTVPRVQIYLHNDILSVKVLSEWDEFNSCNSSAADM